MKTANVTFTAPYKKKLKPHFKLFAVMRTVTHVQRDNETLAILAQSPSILKGNNLELETRVVGMFLKVLTI